MSKTIDLTGQVFNRLTVLYRAGSSGGKATWHCKCECGNECDVIGQYLRNGHTKSCGCLQKERTAMAAKKNALDLTNQTFGFLTAIEPTEKRQGSNVIWKCKCKCGNFTEVAASDLTHLKIKSCGCKRNQSYGELEIEELLKQNAIHYQKEYSFSNLKTEKGGAPRYDFAILNNKQEIIRLIEFDGKQHYLNVAVEKWQMDFSTIQKNDKLKNEYAIKNNIPLVRIPYWEQNKITIEMIMGNQYLIN